MNIFKLLNLLIFLSALYIKPYSQTFTEHLIDPDFKGICKVKVYDLDKDGDLDIIGGSEHTPYSTSVGIAWWRNEGGSPLQWSKFQISGSFMHVMSVDAGYIDNDTFPDIICSSWENGKISWWKNSGDPTQNWTEQILKSGLSNAHDAVIYDLNNDEKNDIITVSSGDNLITILYNVSNPGPFWVEDTISTSLISPKSVSVSDLNNDSEPDIVATADGSDDILWFNNNGGLWEGNYVTNYFNGSANTCIVDLNNDNQEDIIASAWESNEISYWICNDINTNNWTKTMVTNDLTLAVSVSGNDIDQDGDIDIIAVAKVPGELAIFYNNSFEFTKTTINPDLYGGAALSVIDIDEDGDEDIITGAGIYGDLFWYENIGVTNLQNIEPVSDDFKVYPNPFKTQTTIEYLIYQNSNVSLKLHDVLGREIKTLYNGYQSPGLKKILFSGNMASRGNLLPGIYVLNLNINGRSFIKKVILNE